MINNPFDEDGVIECQWCHSGEWLENGDGARNNFCGQCGHKIDWPEVNLHNWNDPLVNLPEFKSDVIVKYGNEEIKAYYSSKGEWMAPNAIVYWREPDAWKYLED